MAEQLQSPEPTADPSERASPKSYDQDTLIMCQRGLRTLLLAAKDLRLASTGVTSPDLLRRAEEVHSFADDLEQLLPSLFPADEQ